MPRKLKPINLTAKTKVCTRCGKRKLKDQFTAHSGRRDGLQSRCRVCVNEANNAAWHGYKRQDRMDIVRRHKYGLEPDDYRNMLKKQKRCCAICGEKTVLVVDHDHQTGVVRGLLCHPCNKGIGHLKDDPEIVTKALAYLLHSQG
jgi:hypothetical protein